MLLLTSTECQGTTGEPTQRVGRVPKKSTNSTGL